MPTKVPLTPEEQEKYFEDSNTSVKRHAFYMKAALDDANLHEALRNASNMINELRTSKLFPTRYYELYMNVTNELNHLESYIEDDFKKKHSNDPESARIWLKDLYDRVQYAGNIVPRLYLLITVGGVIIKAHRTSHDEVMKVLFDLVEMTKGVQHPTRGLFLRNYLSQISKGFLPDVPDTVTVTNIEEHPIVKQSLEFVLQNFGEMTRLWVRMQHQGAVRDRSRREKERLQLRMLIGTNLRRISELNAVSLAVYKEFALKKLGEKIIKCKDRIAQEYLMDCIIHVFADEYHLATLDEFLKTCASLHATVEIKNIITSLMDRLSNFSEENRQLFEERDVFSVFQSYCAQIIAKHKKMSLENILSLYVALVHFAAKCYPGKDEYIAILIQEAVKEIEKHDGNVPADAISHIRRLLTTPLVSMDIRALDIPQYTQLSKYLSFHDSLSVSSEIAMGLAKPHVRLSSSDVVEQLFGLISPLIYDQDETPELTEDDMFQFEEEQYLVARLIFCIHSDDTDEHYKALHTARKYFGKGGDKRLPFTFPSLVYNALGLLRRIYAREQNGEEVRLPTKKGFQFVHQISTAYGQHVPSKGVRMWLDVGLSAHECNLSNISYECISQALSLYEEQIVDSNEQFEAIRCIVGTLQKCVHIDEESFDTLRTKAAQYSNRLLKKHAQARAVSSCAHLYWDTLYKEPEKVSKCLQKGLKIANGMMDSVDMITIFVEILNKYTYFLLQTCELDVSKISGLIDIIKSKLSETEDDDSEMAGDISETKSFFRLTCQYIRDMQNNEDVTVAQAFQEISL